MRKHVGTAVAVGLCLAAASPGAAQEPLRSDTLQTLGVGARAIGLGGAFVSIADDVSAIFWNPAGLTKLQRRQLAFDFRTLPKSDLNLLDPLSPRGDVGSTSPQFSFGGVSFPLGERGAIAFGRTLGGYSQTSTLQDTAGGILLNEEIARYWFNSVAYGRSVPRVPGDFRVGLAAHWVEANGLTSGRVQGGTQREIQDSGDGATFSLGLLYTPPAVDRLSLGFTYLHPTSINGLDDAAPTFGDRIAGRVSGGASYLFTNFNEAKRKERLLGSFEIRHYFGADDEGAAELRDDTVDFHVGAEYRRGFGKDEADKWVYLRSGFYTRNSTNDSIFFDDRVATVGVGFEKVNQYRADVALEISTETGDPLVTTSLRFNLDRLFGRRASSSPAPGAPGAPAAPAAPGGPMAPAAPR